MYVTQCSVTDFTC